MEKNPKRKKKLSSTVGKKSGSKKSFNDRWISSDIDPEHMLSTDNVGGFIGLEELDNYDAEELKNLLAQPTNKKRRRKPLQDEDAENNMGSEIVDVNESSEGNEKLGTDGKLESKDQVSKSDSGEVKKLTKKERRKEKRKQSFKLLLKERRKQRRELKRKERARKSPNENVKEIKNEKSDNVNRTENDVPGEKNDMSDWMGLGVPDEILKALNEKKFTSPTPIQRETLPSAILSYKDIVGAAETGSGKTLAFGIPLLRHIMELKTRRSMRLEKRSEENAAAKEEEEKPLYALILTPTRELALQIHSHINDVAKYTDIKSAVVVGGLAEPKQERLLSKCPEIVIGTPGRLHKLITNGDLHLNKFDSLKFFVIDECDRMLEYGHFKELDEIIDMVSRSKSKKQTFLFSATLTLPQNHKRQKKGKSSDQKQDLQTLIDKVGLSPKAKVIDLTTKHVTASMLQQLKVMCTNEEKEIYLLYFLMTHPGRTIVFVNSIALTKRLCSFLKLLGRDPLQLHAGKQQRQRLKYLDRFVNDENGLLIATDVAARGLDIPKVQNVVHFQLPVDPKIYIHRSGRTARAKENGLSFIVEGPEDFNNYKKISQVLKLGADIPSLKVDLGYLDGIKARVTLAKKIDKEEHKAKQESMDSKWMDRVAKSMEIEVDHDSAAEPTKQQKLALNRNKKELQRLLNTKLIPKGFSGTYPTREGSLMTLKHM